MADIPCFAHTPLDNPLTQIRLVYVPLLLEPILDGQLLQCKLKTVDLSEMPHPFTAVSYAWGDLANSRTIILDGHSLTVSDNLYWFLYHVSIRERAPIGEPEGVPMGRKLTRWFWYHSPSLILLYVLIKIRVL